MTLEDLTAALAALTNATTSQTQAVGVQQTAVANAVAAFTATTARVAALNKVENTADLEKRISTAVQEALDAKQGTLVSGESLKRVNGQSLLGEGDLVIQRSATSINRVAYDDRATLRALSPQADDTTSVESLGFFMWSASKLEPDDDETCFSTALGQWLLRAPAWDLLDAWALHEQSITDDWREDEPKRFAAYLLANK